MEVTKLHIHQVEAVLLAFYPFSCMVLSARQLLTKRDVHFFNGENTNDTTDQRFIFISLIKFKIPMDVTCTM